MAVAPLQLPSSQAITPSVDWAPLANLGKVYEQAQAKQQLQQALSGGINTSDPQSLSALAAKVLPYDSTMGLSLAQLGTTAANTQYQHGRDTTNDQWRAQEAARAQQNADRSYGLQVRSADRQDQTPEEKAADRAKAARSYGIDPTTPEGKRYVLTGELPTDSDKPYPVETLSGTKFMVKKPGGGFTMVDPMTLGAAALTAAAGAPPPAAAQPAAATPPPAPGSFGDRFGGATPPGAPAGTPPVAGAGPAAAPPTAPSDLTAVDPETGRREAWLKAQPPEVQAYIKKIADYEIDPRTTSIKGGHREQVLSAVAQYDPTYDQNSFGSRAKAIRDFATGTQGNSIRSFDVAVDHLDTLQKYVNALKNGDTPILNRIRNAWQQETGSSLPTNVQAVAPIVGAEVSKAIIGSNNALADREELRQPLQTARSPEQLAGAIEGYKSLMGGQLKGLKKQYEDTTGKKDFDKRIRDTTKSVLMGGESQGSGADQMIQHARDAIAQGAPRDAVIQRLKGAGIDPGGL